MLNLIPAQYKLIALAAAVLALMALSFGAAWRWQVNSYERQISEIRTEYAEAQAAAIRKQQADRAALEQRIGDIDQQRYGELRHAQQEIDRLSAAIADGSRRLSVRASCPAGGVPAAAGAVRLDAGTQRIDIHPADAAAIVRITGDADACAVKLSALQDWARSVSR